MSTEPQPSIAYICATCGVQHTPSPEPPSECAICEDERQFIGWDGQQWTTLESLREGHTADVREEEPGLLGLGMKPTFAIGQRALLAQSDAGNVLWDCIPLIDDEIVDAVQQRGGLIAIAISHPHYYSSMVEWAKTFDAPIYIHEADARWVMRPDSRVVFWEGEERRLGPDLTLVRLGGHFAGGTVLHWAAGQSGAGALLSGDIIQVVQDRRWVSFMRSYPNLIPLPGAAVQRMVSALAPYPFERIYGAWYDRIVASDAKRAVERSAQRYVRALEGNFDETA
jgi:glyoxylase-like metal-dependent hydrolase (beta-lactamase superfamily II)